MKEIDELFETIEEYRNKEELREYINSRYELIEADKRLTELLQLKRGRFKEFREELIPLAVYALSPYAREEAEYRLVVGNQQYDCIEKVDGREEKIEITGYLDGRLENILMRTMIEDGVGHADGQDFFESRMEFFNGFRKNVEKKLEKPYWNTRIIFVISQDIYGIVRPDNDETHEDIIIRLRSIINDYHFANNDIYMLVPDEKLFGVSEQRIVPVACRGRLHITAN